MKRRLWKIALLLAVPLALFAFVMERASWRPQYISLGILPRYMLFSPDSGTLLVEDWANEFKSDYVICDTASRKIRGRMHFADSPCFIEKGKYIAAYWQAGSVTDAVDEQVRVYSTIDGKPVATGPKNFLPLGVLADESTIIGTMPNNDVDARRLFRWNWRSDSDPKRFLRLPKGSGDMSDNWFWMLPDKSTLMDGNRHFMDLFTGKVRFQRKHDPNVLPSDFSMAFSASAGVMAFDVGRKAQILNYKTGLVQGAIPVALPTGPVDTIALSPDGAVLAGASRDGGEINLWSIPGGRLLRQLKGQQDSIISLAFSPDGRTLASCSDVPGFEVALWRIK